MTDTPRTGLEFVDAGTTDIDQPVNNNALALDAVVGMSVVSATTTAQPSLTSPADDGKVYILPAGRTGTNWAAQAVGTIAQFYSSTWYFYAPWAGLRARAADSGIIYQYTSSWAVWANVAAQSALSGTGATTGFLRGDGTISSTVTADFEVRKNVGSYQILSASSVNGWRVLGNVTDSVDFGFGVEQYSSGSWTSKYFFSGAEFSPSTDNSRTIGSASFRWSEVFAGNGTINTSDARLKTEVRPFTQAELLAAKDLSEAVGFFRFLERIEEKAGAAREHCGLTVQDAIKIMASHGLDPFNYGFICFDQWDEQKEVCDDDGNIIRQYRPAGDRYSFRPDQLDRFISKGIMENQKRIEARLSALESKG